MKYLKALCKFFLYIFLISYCVHVHEICGPSFEQKFQWMHANVPTQQYHRRNEISERKIYALSENKRERQKKTSSRQEKTRNRSLLMIRKRWQNRKLRGASCGIGKPNRIDEDRRTENMVVKMSFYIREMPLIASVSAGRIARTGMWNGKMK